MVADAGSGGERVRVVVVNHDAGDVTLRCLDALASTEWPPEQLDVVLVDNASRDGVVEEVRRTRPDVSVIASAENEGFGRACNRGMGDLAGIDHVALINNDAVPEPDWLVPLVAALAADGELGAVSPKVLLDVASGRRGPHPGSSRHHHRHGQRGGGRRCRRGERHRGRRAVPAPR